MMADALVPSRFQNRSVMWAWVVAKVVPVPAGSPRHARKFATCTNPLKDATKKLKTQLMQPCTAEELRAAIADAESSGVVGLRPHTHSVHPNKRNPSPWLQKPLPGTPAPPNFKAFKTKLRFKWEALHPYSGCSLAVINCRVSSMGDSCGIGQDNPTCTTCFNEFSTGSSML
eukprot:6457902-Amphidinium_carterae.1